MSNIRVFKSLPAILATDCCYFFSSSFFLVTTLLFAFDNVVELCVNACHTTFQPQGSDFALSHSSLFSLREQTQSASGEMHLLSSFLTQKK